MKTKQSKAARPSRGAGPSRQARQSREARQFREARQPRKIQPLGGMARACAAALAAVAASLGVFSPSAAAAYPEKPVRLIVPFSPGGGADSLARPLAEKLGQRLGQPVVIENKSGASSNIGTALVASAAPDGYTVLINTDGIALAPLLYRNLNYDFERDLRPVSYVAKSPLVFASNKDVPAATLQEFIALARKQPDTLNFANPGVGTPHHLAFALFAREAGVKLGEAVYRGGGPSLVDVLGGHVHVGMFTLGAVRGNIESGALKPLAVMTEKRTALAPKIPTMAESGLPEAHLELGFVVLAPAKTPDDIVERLHKEIAAVVREPAFQDVLRQQGYEPYTTTPAQTADMFRSEYARWQPILQDLQIRLD